MPSDEEIAARRSARKQPRYSEEELARTRVNWFLAALVIAGVVGYVVFLVGEDRALDSAWRAARRQAGRVYVQGLCDGAYRAAERVEVKFVEADFQFLASLEAGDVLLDRASTIVPKTN